jgi:FixJ family two-component response regulator
MRQATAKLVSAFGFGMEAFASAAAFLNVAATREADCLVVDIQLDGMSGLELAHQLTVVGFKYPIIFMIALDGESVRSQAAAVGGVATLSKPFPAQVLIEALIKATG